MSCWVVDDGCCWCTLGCAGGISNSQWETIYVTSRQQASCKTPRLQSTTLQPLPAQLTASCCSRPRGSAACGAPCHSWLGRTRCACGCSGEGTHCVSWVLGAWGAAGNRCGSRSSGGCWQVGAGSGRSCLPHTPPRLPAEHLLNVLARPHDDGQLAGAAQLHLCLGRQAGAGAPVLVALEFAAAAAEGQEVALPAGGCRTRSRRGWSSSKIQSGGGTTDERWVGGGRQRTPLRPWPAYPHSGPLQRLPQLIKSAAGEHIAQLSFTLASALVVRQLYRPRR